MTRFAGGVSQIASPNRGAIALPGRVPRDGHREYDKDWDGYASTIVARKQAPEWAVLREARLSHYREFFRVGPDDRVLDAGCGHGEYSVFALKDGARVWAFDYSQKMVEQTRQAIRDDDLHVEEVTRASVTEIPYPDDHFDVVFCLAVLDHLADRDGALRELVRVLRPGGRLYLDVPNAFAVHWRACFGVMRLLGMYPSGKIHFFTPRELTNMVRRCGCKPLERLGLTFCPPLSGIYTTDLRRLTVLPEFLIRPLDRLYLTVERFARRHIPFRWLCWHQFIRAVKLP